MSVEVEDLDQYRFPGWRFQVSHRSLPFGLLGVKAAGRDIQHRPQAVNRDYNDNRN